MQSPWVPALNPPWPLPRGLHSHPTRRGTPCGCPVSPRSPGNRRGIRRRVSPAGPIPPQYAGCSFALNIQSDKGAQNTTEEVNQGPHSHAPGSRQPRTRGSWLCVNAAATPAPKRRETTAHWRCLAHRRSFYVVDLSCKNCRLGLPEDGGSAKGTRVLRGTHFSHGACEIVRNKFKLAIASNPIAHFEFEFLHDHVWLRNRG